MTNTQERLLSILGNSLFEPQKSLNKIPTTEELEELLNEAKSQAVYSLIDTSDSKRIARNMRVGAAHAYLTCIMQGIPFVTIKGIASSMYYPDPVLREMGDVDFYVLSEDYEKTIGRLLQNGFEIVTSGTSRHENFKKNNVLFELHTVFKGVPNAVGGITTNSISAEKTVRKHLADIISTAEIIKTEYGQVVVPDAFHHGLIMLLHIAGHITREGIGLRHLCDWAVYVNQVNVCNFRTQLIDMGLWTFACQLTSVSSKYLGLPKQAWAGQWDDDFLNSLIEDILSAGNFGRKSANRMLGISLFDDGTIVKSLAARINRKYPFLKNKSIFLPAGFIVFFTQYLNRVLFRKQRILVPRNIIEGKKRKELYRKFALFEDKNDECLNNDGKRN